MARKAEDFDTYVSLSYTKDVLRYYPWRMPTHDRIVERYERLTYRGFGVFY